MIRVLPENLILLAKNCLSPLYAVGGSVRDFLNGKITPLTDWDIAGSMTEDELAAAARQSGFHVAAVYRNTGTVRIEDGAGVPYEFTRFRTDKYVRGEHSPCEIAFTADIAVDARRRDFTANAVYYDIRAQKYCDPLGGIDDIKTHTFRTVAPAEKVFGEDGLRLMRLARLSAETGYTPDEACLAGAKRNASLIRDIVPERIFHELERLLRVPDGSNAYRGLCILRDTGVLHEILPELTAGEGMPQRADFHDHDVLEHSLRCVRYAPPEIRFAALLHDVGKPWCYVHDGNFHNHPKVGADLSRAILNRLKAPKKLTDETALLVLLHMRDFNLQMRESRVRRAIIEHFDLFPQLLLLYQADFSACKDDLSPAPARVKWQRICNEMEKEGAPRSLKELKINGNDLKKAGVPAKEIGNILNELLYYAAENGARNNRETLLKRVEKQRTKGES